MSVFEIRKGIYFVGAFNPNLRVFDIIMRTEYGTSYNAYLVKGEKTALIETVHDRFTEEYFENIRTLTDIKKIDYIILNHTEPDHSGSLLDIIRENPDITVVSSTAGLKNLKAITNRDFKSIVARDGDALDLGSGKVLKFIIAPNLHWPDSMFTWLPSEKTLFSCDFLGCHYCETRLFDSKISYPDKYNQAFKFYFDVIFRPFKPFVRAGLDKIKGLDIEVICPSHGPVLKEKVKDAIELYGQWSAPAQKGDRKYVPVFYVSAYGYTKKMAEFLVEGLRENGVESEGLDIICNDAHSLEKKLDSSDGFLIGSPTINRDALKPVWDLISSIDAIANKGKPCAVFGSYGWSGEAVPMLVERLKGLKLKVVGDGYKVCFVPDEQDYSNLKEFARQFAEVI